MVLCGARAMKRVQDNDKLQFELETDYGEEECKGVLTLPSNAKIYRSKFSLKDPSDVEVDDLALIASVITHCSHHIALMTDKVNSTLSRHRRVFDGTINLTYYVVFLEMPTVMNVDSQQINDIHLLSKLHISDPIVIGTMSGGGLSLKIGINSTKNPVDPESVTITRTHIKRLNLCTYDTTDESASIKRIRRS